MAGMPARHRSVRHSHAVNYLVRRHILPFLPTDGRSPTNGQYV